MPSPEEESQHTKESGSGQPSGPPPPLPAGPPPAMGYPGYPPPYQPYPNGQYGNQNMYTQAPPAAYYGSSAYPTNQDPRIRNQASGFFRTIFAGLVILLILLLVSSTITWLILHPRIPGVAVTRFAVSGFNVTGPVLSANWTVNLAIRNPNNKLKLFFNRIHSFIFYSDANGDDDSLATTMAKPINMNTGETVDLGVSLTAGEKDQPMVPNWVVDDLRKARETGTVAFSLRMIVSANFKTDGWASSGSAMKIFCERLSVPFDRNTGNGFVSLPKPHDCIVYV